MSGESSQTDVLVMGGGVIGLACAHYLQQLGRQVTVIDRGRIGGGCSHGNCGLICPSHVLPLAEPGAAWAGLRSMLRPGSALRVGFRWDVPLWRWLWKFSRRCNRADMLAAARGIEPLLEQSLALYHRLHAEHALASEWQSRGQIFAFATARAAAAYEPTDRLLQAKFGITSERMDGKQLMEREPSLKANLACGWYYHEDAQVRPDRLMAAWQNLLAERGVVFRENCTVLDWTRDGQGSLTAVRTSAGEMSAQAFVLAMGVWTSGLASWLGMKLPLQPGKGYSVTFPRPELCPRIPLLLPERRVVITPFEGGLRLGSIMEFAGLNGSIPRGRLKLLTAAARDYLQRPPPNDPRAETWHGFRPMTYDSLPIIDRSPRHRNVFVAAGHGMLGVSMAPATGKLVAALVCDCPPDLDPAPYAATRFE